MEHANCEDGENLYQASGGNSTHADATKAWLSEEKDYHGEQIGQGDFAAYGHYTQCMWKDTTKLGMATARTLDGMIFIVGRYSPAGNCMGDKPY